MRGIGGGWFPGSLVAAGPTQHQACYVTYAKHVLSLMPPPYLPLPLPLPVPYQPRRPLLNYPWLHLRPSFLWLHQASLSLRLRLGLSSLCLRHGHLGLHLHLGLPPLQLCWAPQFSSNLALPQPLIPMAPSWSPGPSVSPSPFDSSWLSLALSVLPCFH